MRLPISDWHHISYRFGVIAAYCSNIGHSVFEPQFEGGLGTTYDVNLGLNGKRIVDFLLVLIELFRYALRLRRYERISVQNWRFRSNGAPKFQVEGIGAHRVSTILLLRKLG